MKKKYNTLQVHRPPPIVCIYDLATTFYDPVPYIGLPTSIGCIITIFDRGHPIAVILPNPFSLSYWCHCTIAARRVVSVSPENMGL
jgi:hypothetical protein